jgi:hypothetical protein
MKRLPRLLFWLALLIVAGSAGANPYGYAYYRTVTVDHTKVQSSLNGYAYIRSITIDHTKVGTVNNTDQTNFPVLINGTYSYLATVANSGQIQNTVALNGQTVPADLIFTSDPSCGTNLNWEIASYSASTGAMEAWVQVPTLSHSADTVIYACYGKSSVTTYQGSATSVWDSHFTAVYHLPDGTTLTTKDSTSNAKNGTSSGAAATTGKIDGGGDFAGNQYISTAVTTAFTNFTACVWFKSSNDSGSKRLVDKAYDTGFYLGHEGTGAANMWGGGVHENTSPYGIFVTLANGSWHQLCSVLNGGTHYIYGDGGAVSNSNAPASTSIDSSALYIGESTAAGGFGFVGQMDEVEISDSARSLDWINTEYNNQNSPSTFTTIGSQQTTGPSLTNFPVLVSCTCTYLKTGANGGQIQKTATLNGQTVPVDLIFTSDAAGQTLLNWEVASYNASTGAIEVWVKIPTLSATADTVIYMWYNNANIAATYLGSATSAWDANYQAIYHLPDGTTLSANDSTSNANNGTNHSGTAATGQIDGAISLNGTSQYASVADAASLRLSNFTLSAWVNFSSVTASYNTILEKSSNGTTDNYYMLYHSSTLECGFTTGGSTFHSHTSAWTPTAGTWYHVVCTYDGAHMITYVNGVSTSASETNTPNTSAGGLDLGASTYNNNNNWFRGSIDEARISAIARSADWIKTEYTNQNSPSTFTAVGSQVIAHTHAKGLFE